MIKGTDSQERHPDKRLEIYEKSMLLSELRAFAGDNPNSEKSDLAHCVD